MSPTHPSPHNPSQAVERIREIIVGRHLEKLEQRVARVESSVASGGIPTAWEDRLCTTEARVEALQHNFQRLAETTRENAELQGARQRDEIQRLAAQIQQVAAIKSADSGQPAIDKLEHKVGSWLTNWQNSLHTHLNDRETRMGNQIRQEIATLWEHTESQITRIQSRMIDHDRVEERFKRIAAAARALADCAAPSGPEHSSL